MALKRNISVTIFLMMGILLSCEETSDVSIALEPTPLLVVEGVMTNENIRHVVKLSSPYSAQNGTGSPINNAIMSISDGTETIALTPTDSGHYLTPTMRFLSAKEYVLTINYNGKQFTAHDSALPVEPLTALSYVPANDGYRFNFFETGSQANYIEYNVNWEGTSSCDQGCKARLIYYDLKTVDIQEIFKPNKTDFIFPHGSTVVRRKFSVSNAYRSFLRSMLSETEWRGSVFDIQRDNAATNLSEGAIGFFAVSTVVSDTITIP